MKSSRCEYRPAPLRTSLIALAALLLAACGAAAPHPDSGDSAPVVAMAYVVRRGWHTDIAFETEAMPASLAAVAHDFPGARYLVFGFGDHRYLLARNKGSASIEALLWPERGLILVTALKAPPAEAFGADQVMPLALSQSQAEAMGEFVWQSLQQDSGGAVHPYADGPYTGSLFYASTRIYAGVRTCNTWTAQALHAGGLPVGGFGVLFADQVWMQLQGLRSNP